MVKNVVNTQNAEQDIYRLGVSAWVGVLAVTLLLLAIFFDGIREMVDVWENKEEYGYGYIIPAISLFFIWQKSDRLEQLPFHGSWTGVAVVVLGVALFWVGSLSTIYVVIQYALLIVLFGLGLSFAGWQGIRIIFVPLLFLIFMIPLPVFLYNTLSGQLQLISSELGVAVIRLFGISVYLEGNVIDLGTYKLQVVEACSGLRYLFPLTSLAFIAAYLFRGALWKKGIIFISSIPITVLMNSFRIGMIGVLVENWGVEQAEGFLHYFEGWVIFMACMAILIAEMSILAKFGRNKQSLRQAFGIDFPERAGHATGIQRRRLPASFLASGLVLVATALGAAAVEQRAEIIPERVSFPEFPTQIGEWHGRRDKLEQIYLDVLKLDDYIVSDYATDDGRRVNFYVAYYGSQRAGESAHSPRSCLPGGGWLIKDLSRREIDGVSLGGQPLKVNRVVIAKGDHRQLVYYWFQQRGRNITNEYLVKWYLFWDALTRNRTDGALVRLTASVPPGENIQHADERLATFAQDISGVIDPYIPN